MSEPRKRFSCPHCEYWTDGASGEMNLRTHLKKHHGATFHREPDRRRRHEPQPATLESAYRRGYNAGYHTGKRARKG